MCGLFLNKNFKFTVLYSWQHFNCNCYSTFIISKWLFVKICIWIITCIFSKNWRNKTIIFYMSYNYIYRESYENLWIITQLWCFITPLNNFLIFINIISLSIIFKLCYLFKWGSYNKFNEVCSHILDRMFGILFW